MIPWTLDHFMKVLIGMGTSEESRLQSLLQANPGGSPSFKTIQKLFNVEKPPLRSTYAAYGLEFLHEMVTSESFRDLPETLSYEHLIKHYFEVAREYDGHEKLHEYTRLSSGLLSGFPRFLSSIVAVEVWLSNRTKPPFPEFATKLSGPDFRREFDQFDNVKNALVAELHFFIFYMAALEMDITDLGKESCILPPSCFVPSHFRGSLRYPMETFWEWFRGKSGISKWNEFADNMGTTTALLSKYRKAKSLDPSPSYKQLRGFCMELWPLQGLSRRVQKILEVTFVYAMARIMQEHSHRCLDLATEYFTEESDIEGFYLRHIQECKKWVQEIPLHPCFKAV